jgi:hypothetical protein
MSNVVPEHGPSNPTPLNGKVVEDLRATSQRLAVLADTLQAREAALQAREKEFERVLAERDHYKDLAFGVLIHEADKMFADMAEGEDLYSYAMRKGARPAKEVMDELFPPEDAK